MSQYKEYQFILQSPENQREIFIALLAQAGFEGFVETGQGFLAYTDTTIHPDEVLKDLNWPYQLEEKNIKEENWNRSWEQQIKPLIIDNRIYIKTSFHPDKKLPIVITIDPKMSFGTGHHETTYLMIKQMLEIDLHAKDVIDMGAGTGVLSILAKKMHANNVTAIDNDKWAYENMIENFEKNKTGMIKAIHGDAKVLSDLPVADVFLANINRNILLQDMHQYISKIKSGGLLILSGFYQQDVPLLEEEALKYGMIFESKRVKNDWTSLTFRKK